MEQTDPPAKVASNDQLGPVAEAHKLTDRQIADVAFAVLRAHNDDRLWRALTYDSGPYDLTKPNTALCHLARVFFGAGVGAGEEGERERCGRVYGTREVAMTAELLAARELADSEGSRAVEYLRRARKAEALLRDLAQVCTEVNDHTHESWRRAVLLIGNNATLALRPNLNSADTPAA